MANTHSEGDDLAARLVNLSVEEPGYPSIPPPGAAQSPGTLTFSNINTPTGRGSASYSTPFLEGNGQVVYYTPMPNLATLPPAAFSPGPNGPLTATPYNYDPMTSQPVVRDQLIESSYPPFTEPYSPMHFNQDNRAGRGRGEGNDDARVYRPPQIQQQQHHQQQQQQNALLQQHQQAAAMQQYYGYGDQAQMWWAQQPMGGYIPPNIGGNGGERKKAQLNNNLQSPITQYTPTSRTNQTGQSLYTPQSNSFLPGTGRGSNLPRNPNNYGLVTPYTPSISRPNRALNGNKFTPRAASANFNVHGPTHPHTPYTPGRLPSTQHQRHPEDSGNNLPRSAILEDFRLNKLLRRFDLNEVFGHVIEFCGDQHGSRFIQQKLETCSADERQQIFDEVLPNAFQIMTDVFGNYVVQKMFELGDQRQKASLAAKMEGHVLALSMQTYGCRVVQKALEYVLLEQRNKLIAELEPHILECVKSANANHVIQRLVILGPPQSVPNAFLGSLAALAADAFGCRVVQKIFEVLPESMTRELLNELHPHAVALMQDPFGNYVVQSIIVSGTQADRDRIIDQLKGQMTPLSRHKFGSNVCEKALQHARPEDRRILVTELVNAKPDGQNQIGMLLRDAFGNFPIQTALTCADDDQRAEILDLIIPNIPHIRQTPVGKRLEARLAQWEAEGLIASATEAGANMAAYLAAQAPSSPTHRDSFSSSASTDSSDNPHSVSASSSTGVTSPSFPQADKNLRSTASTPIRGPLLSHSRRQLEKSESRSTMVDYHKDDENKEPANDEKTLETLLQ